MNKFDLELNDEPFETIFFNCYYTLKNTSKAFIKKEVYLDKIKNKKSEIDVLTERFMRGNFNNKQSLEDGIYEIGFFSPKYESDEVLYALAKVEKEILIYVDYTYEKETTRLYPQNKKAYIEYGIYKGMMIYNKSLRAFAKQGHSTIMYFLNKR